MNFKENYGIFSRMYLLNMSYIRIHLLAKLELVVRWKDEEAVFLVEKEKDSKIVKAVQKINKILNHKQKEQTYYVYRSVGKLDGETKKLIDEVVDMCEICKKNSRSKSKPLVAIPRATYFNLVGAIDLKSVGDRYGLWMVCTFTKFVKGSVINYKCPETVMMALHETWCMDLGFPTVRFWCDNGGEFRTQRWRSSLTNSV